MSNNAKTVAALWLLSVLLNSYGGYAYAECLIDKMRFSHQAERTRLVLDMKDATPYKFKHTDTRAHLTLAKAECVNDPPLVDTSNSYILDMAWRYSSDGVLSLILHASDSTVFRHFALPSNSTRGNRIVVDIKPAAAKALTIGRDIIVAVDAGHGGKDSGAISATGYQEKHLTLLVARYMVEELNSTLGLRGVLTREHDVYLSLNERVHLARNASADIFVSVHGDSFHNSKVSGVSVYALSANAAENVISKHALGQSALEDTVTRQSAHTLKEINPNLPVALANLSMRFVLTRSIEMGAYILRALRKTSKIHRETIVQAGFVVLQPIDIPSILVEIGFLSNLTDVRALRSTDYQRMLASAMTRGLKEYFREHPLADSYFAQPKQPSTH